MHDWNDGVAWGWGPWLGMSIMMVVLVIAVAWVVVTLIRHSARSSTVGPPGPATPDAPSVAAAILDERFARGEIDAEEYTQRRALLRGPDGPAR